MKLRTLFLIFFFGLLMSACDDSTITPDNQDDTEISDENGDQTGDGNNQDGTGEGGQTGSEGNTDGDGDGGQTDGDGDGGTGDGDGKGGTSDGDGGTGEVTPMNVTWFELPQITDSNSDGILDDDPTLYYAHHLCNGTETYGHNGQRARNYTVCYSAKHHCPYWVAAPRHAMYEGGANRTDAYQPDPKIPAEIQYQQKSSGNSTYNRGHMLGSAERTSSSNTNRQVFYYTNIAPQHTTTFNTGGGAWNNLEELVDGQVCRDTLYEVIGCYFEDYTDAYGETCEAKTITYGGRNDVSCPTMFYYVLLRTKSGKTGKSILNCTSDELKCVAFVLRHNMEKGHDPQSEDMMSVTDLEKLTGVTYFPHVPHAPKSTFTPSDWL